MVEAQLAIKAGADALGLVAAMPSGPGPIADDAIATIAAGVPPSVATFLLTRHVTPQSIIGHVRATGTNTVQIVDDEIDPAAYAVIRAALPNLRIVQVIHVTGPEALDKARVAAPHVDAILLDSGAPKAKRRQLGGTGRVHDWTISRRVVEAVDRPVYLAGGLTPENVRAAYRAVRPFAIDVCSGVRSDDRLDTEKLSAFVAALREPTAA